MGFFRRKERKARLNLPPLLGAPLIAGVLLVTTQPRIGLIASARSRTDGLLLQILVTLGMTIHPPRTDPRMKEEGEEVEEDPGEVVPREKARMTRVPRKAVPVRTMAPTKKAAAVVKRMVPTEKDLAVVAVQGVAEEVASVAVVAVVTPRDLFPRRPSVSSTFLTRWMTMV